MIVRYEQLSNSLLQEDASYSTKEVLVDITFIAVVMTMALMTYLACDKKNLATLLLEKNIVIRVEKMVPVMDKK